MFYPLSWKKSGLFFSMCIRFLLLFEWISYGWKGAFFIASLIAISGMGSGSQVARLIEDGDEGERELPYSLWVSLTEQFSEGGVGQIAEPVRETAESVRNRRQHHLHRPDTHHKPFTALPAKKRTREVFRPNHVLLVAGHDCRPLMVLHYDSGSHLVMGRAEAGWQEGRMFWTRAFIHTELLAVQPGAA